jgi:hypothetical protein
VSGEAFWNPLPGTTGGGAGTGDFYGVHVTRLSNYVLTNEDPFPFDTENVDSDGIWDPGNPTVFTVQRTGWYFVGADITTLGTDYGGASNANLLIAILKNWDGVSAQLGYYIAVERYENGIATAAQLNSLLQLVYLEVGDELQLTLISAAGSSLLVESNPSDGVPSGYLTDSGPGTLSPHFYLVWAQGNGAPAGGAGEVLMADGVTPPEPLTNEAGTDWLYEDV